MGRSIRRALVCAGLAAFMMFSGSGTASASAIPLDSWSTASSLINSVAGTSRCTVGASTPVQESNIMAGSGSINCNKRYIEIQLTVCIQAKPALAPDAEWVEAGCAPTKIVQNSFGTSNTARAQCLPGNMLYRTQSHAKGFQVGDTSENPTFDLLFHGSYTAKDCFL